MSKILFLFLLLSFPIPSFSEEDALESVGSCNCQVDTLSASKRKKLGEGHSDGGGYVGVGSWDCKGKQSQSGWEAACKEIYAKEIENIKAPIKKVLVHCDDECLN